MVEQGLGRGEGSVMPLDPRKVGSRNVFQHESPKRESSRTSSKRFEGMSQVAEVAEGPTANGGPPLQEHRVEGVTHKARGSGLPQGTRY